MSGTYQPHAAILLMYTVLTTVVDSLLRAYPFIVIAPRLRLAKLLSFGRRFIIRRMTEVSWGMIYYRLHPVRTDCGTTGENRTHSEHILFHGENKFKTGNEDTLQSKRTSRYFSYITHLIDEHFTHYQ